MTTTPNLELTLLEDSQAGAHTTVNAALMVLDALVGGRPMNVMLNARIDAWTSMPSPLTEFRGIASGTNAILDLTSFTTVKLGASVTSAGHSTPAKLRAQYSVNSGSSWAYFDSAGSNSGPSVNIDTTGPKKSSAITMDAAARTTSTWVRIVGLDGNGSVTPQFGPIFLEFQ